MNYTDVHNLMPEDGSFSCSSLKPEVNCKIINHYTFEITFLKETNNLTGKIDGF